jgi:hypothetical protein
VTIGFVIPTIAPGEWWVGLASWIISDGNYPEFNVGERRRFALEFFGPELTATAANKRPSADLQENGQYAINARVVYRRDKLAVVDFGLLAYSDQARELPDVGSWVTGEIHLSIDHYAYLEIYGSRKDVPPAVYTWTVMAIRREVGPLITVRKNILDRQGVLMRDPKRLRYEAVNSTAEGSDYNQLVCRLEDEPPVSLP